MKTALLIPKSEGIEEAGRALDGAGMSINEKPQMARMKKARITSIAGKDGA
jgi:hypothetical protein